MCVWGGYVDMVRKKKKKELGKGKVDKENNDLAVWCASSRSICVCKGMNTSQPKLLEKKCFKKGKR